MGWTYYEPVSRALTLEEQRQRDYLGALETVIAAAQWGAVTERSRHIITAEKALSIIPRFQWRHFSNWLHVSNTRRNAYCYAAVTTARDFVAYQLLQSQK